MISNSAGEKRCLSRSITVSTAVLKAVTYMLILSRGRSDSSATSLLELFSLSGAWQLSVENVNARPTSRILSLKGSLFFGDRKTCSPNSPIFPGDECGSSSKEGKWVVDASSLGRLEGGAGGGVEGKIVPFMRTSTASVASSGWLWASREICASRSQSGPANKLSPTTCAAANKLCAPRQIWLEHEKLWRWRP